MMPISRGSIHHRIVDDVRSLMWVMSDPQACQPPSGELRESAEQRIALHFGVKHSTTFPYARTCFYALLKSLNLPVGSEVLMTPYNISPIVHIIYSLGLKPRFIDINLKDYGPLNEQLDSELSRRPGCFLLTYLFGSVPDVPLISSICDRYQVPLIEDISQSIGGLCNGKALGTFGLAAFYSASLTKYVDAYNGGFVITDSGHLHSSLKEFANGMTKPSRRRIRGIIVKTLIWNLALSKNIFSLFTYPVLYLLRVFSRPTFDKLLGPSIKADFSKQLPAYYFEDITQIQLSSILSYLERLQSLLEQRQDCALRALKAYNRVKGATIESSCDNRVQSNSSTYWQFLLHVTETQAAQNELFQMGVETGITNLPNLGSLCGLDLENAKKLKSEYIFLPLHSHIKTFEYEALLGRLDSKGLLA